MVQKIRQSALLWRWLSGVFADIFYTVLGWYSEYCVYLYSTRLVLWTVSTFYSPRLCLCLCPAQSTQQEEEEEGEGEKEEGEEKEQEEVYSAAGRWLR